MTSLKRWISAVLLFCLLITAVPFFAAAEGTHENKVITGNIYYSMVGESVSYPYYYTDSYFLQPASVYNPSLATMSMFMALSGFGKGGVPITEQSVNARTLMANIGFGEIDTNDDFKTYPSTDTMGVIVGNKLISDGDNEYTLLCVNPRSANYGDEWASNFTLGKTGEAQGFAEAASIVESYLQTYVRQYGDDFASQVKVWIVGYSRGAAVANLVAGHLTLGGSIDTVTLEKENIYAYTFETPMGANTSVVSQTVLSSCTNIHNIVNNNDLVTKLAPAAWGFSRYGSNEPVIPDNRTEQNAELFEAMIHYFEMTGADVCLDTDKAGNTVHKVETFDGKKLSLSLSSVKQLGSWQQTENGYAWVYSDYQTVKDALFVNSDKTMDRFCDDLIFQLAYAVGSREAYAEDFEDLLRYLLCTDMSPLLDTEGWSTAWNLFIEKMKSEYGEIIYYLASDNSDKATAALEKIWASVVEEADMDSEAYQEIASRAETLLPYVARLLCISVGSNNAADLLSLLESENIDRIAYAHYPELCLAWLLAEDVNYNQDAEALWDKYLFEPLSVCTYLKKASVGEGTFVVKNGEATHFVTVDSVSGGYTIYDEAQKAYLAYSASQTVITSDQPYTWSYDGGFYAKQVKKASGLFARLFGKTTTVYYYLDLNDGYSVSESYTAPALYQTIYDYSHSDCLSGSDANGHTYTCSRCHTVYTEAHTFDENGKCTCGRYSADVAQVNQLKVTVIPQTTVKKILFWKKSVTTYTVTITPVCAVGVKKVAYSTEKNGAQTTATGFTSDSAPTSFYIHVTDANGDVTCWYYANQQVTKA